MKQQIAALICAAAALWASASVVTDIAPYASLKARPVSLEKPQCLPDGSAQLALVDGGTRIVTVDPRTGAEGETLLNLAGGTRETSIASAEGFTVSPDGSKIMVWRGSRKIYRHSFAAQYYIYEIRSRIMRPLSTDHPEQRAPLWSPDGRMVAYNDPADGNIYLRKLDYDTEVAVTRDGAPGQVINGVPDWTYEEEFATTSSMTWSPDCLTLCWVRLDESRVPTYSLELYGGACDSKGAYDRYPGSFTYKYPVAGEPNAVASVCSYDVETRKTKTLDLPDATAHYIPRIGYAGADDRLVVATLNRDQTRLELLSVNPRSLVSRSLLVETSRAWVIPASYEELSLADDSFVIMSNRSGRTQLYQYNYNGQLLRQLTDGDADVTAYLGCDAYGRHLYQVAAPRPVDRTVRAVDAKGRHTDLSPAGGGCASGWLQAGGRYYTICHSSASQPPRYTLHNAKDDKLLRTLEDNAAYAAAMPPMAQKEFFTFTTRDGVELNGYWVKPPAMDTSRRWPVLLYQYSGPGSQEVLDRWDGGWANYFALHGIIVMCVDPRGTGGRGADFMYSVYKDLGRLETIDLCEAALWASHLAWVDASRIGLWGWSYGGYETLMCQTTGSYPFAAYTAVAPVTSWRLYDTVYTERYMLTPGQNPDGYTASAPLERAPGAGDRLAAPALIMYGTADDNVHPANTLEYISALEAAGHWADVLPFPNMNHSIYGCNSRQVVYGRLFTFMQSHLAL